MITCSDDNDDLADATCADEDDNRVDGKNAARADAPCANGDDDSANDDEPTSWS